MRREHKMNRIVFLVLALLLSCMASFVCIADDTLKPEDLPPLYGPVGTYYEFISSPDSYWADTPAIAMLRPEGERCDSALELPCLPNYICSEQKEVDVYWDSTDGVVDGCYYLKDCEDPALHVSPKESCVSSCVSLGGNESFCRGTSCSGEEVKCTYRTNCLYTALLHSPQILSNCDHDSNCISRDCKHFENPDDAAAAFDMCMPWSKCILGCAPEGASLETGQICCDGMVEIDMDDDGTTNGPAGPTCEHISLFDVDVPEQFTPFLSIGDEDYNLLTDPTGWNADMTAVQRNGCQPSIYEEWAEEDGGLLNTTAEHQVLVAKKVWQYERVLLALQYLWAGPVIQDKNDMNQVGLDDFFGINHRATEALAAVVRARQVAENFRYRKYVEIEEEKVEKMAEGENLDEALNAIGNSAGGVVALQLMAIDHYGRGELANTNMIAYGEALGHLSEITALTDNPINSSDEAIGYNLYGTHEGVYDFPWFNKTICGSSFEKNKRCVNEVWYIGDEKLYLDPLYATNLFSDEGLDGITYAGGAEVAASDAGSQGGLYGVSDAGAVAIGILAGPIGLGITILVEFFFNRWDPEKKVELSDIDIEQAKPLFIARYISYANGVLGSSEVLESEENGEKGWVEVVNSVSPQEMALTLGGENNFPADMIGIVGGTIEEDRRTLALNIIGEFMHELFKGQAVKTKSASADRGDKTQYSNSGSPKDKFSAAMTQTVDYLFKYELANSILNNAMGACLDLWALSFQILFDEAAGVQVTTTTAIPGALPGAPPPAPVPIITPPPAAAAAGGCPPGQPQCVAGNPSGLSGNGTLGNGAVVAGGTVAGGGASLSTNPYAPAYAAHAGPLNKGIAARRRAQKVFKNYVANAKANGNEGNLPAGYSSNLMARLGGISRKAVTNYGLQKVQDFKDGKLALPGEDEKDGKKSQSDLFSDMLKKKGKGGTGKVAKKKARMKGRLGGFDSGKNSRGKKSKKGKKSDLASIANANANAGRDLSSQGYRNGIHGREGNLWTIITRSYMSIGLPKLLNRAPAKKK